MNLKDPARHQIEWWQLHPKLRLILCDIDFWCFQHGIQMVITELIRSDEEQLELYRKGEAKDRTSVHQFGRGGDIRAFADTSLQQQCEDYINVKYPYDPTRPHLKTLLFHSGTAYHGHCQVAET